MTGKNGRSIKYLKHYCKWTRRTSQVSNELPPKPLGTYINAALDSCRSLPRARKTLTSCQADTSHNAARQPTCVQDGKREI